MSESIEFIKIYTDGACQKNPGGPGGWGIYITFHNKNFEIIKTHQNFQGIKSTTNNKMELTAVIEGLKYIKENNLHLKSMKIDLYSDSSYVINGITEWIINWQLENRLDSNNSNVVKNVDLWRELLALKNQIKTINFHWIKAHTKILVSDSKEIKADKTGNAIADELARLGISVIKNTAA